MNDSNLFGVSIRAWLMVFMTIVVCTMGLLKMEVTEPLYSGWLLGLGFYFGQKFSTKNGFSIETDTTPK